MKVYVIHYSEFYPDVCVDEKSAILELKKLGLTEEEINKAFSKYGVHIDDRENISETWISVISTEVIEHKFDESRTHHGRMLKEGIYGIMTPNEIKRKYKISDEDYKRIEDAVSELDMSILKEFPEKVVQDIGRSLLIRRMGGF